MPVTCLLALGRMRRCRRGTGEALAKLLQFPPRPAWTDRTLEQVFLGRSRLFSCARRHSD